VLEGESGTFEIWWLEGLLNASSSVFNWFQQRLEEMYSKATKLQEKTYEELEGEEMSTPIRSSFALWPSSITLSPLSRFGSFHNTSLSGSRYPSWKPRKP